MKTILKRFLILFFLLSFIVLPAAAGFKDDISEIVHYDETGLRGEIWYGNASWYGKKWQGRKTSNGERFDRYELTAAHRTLPFHTKVKVTNMKNNKSVIVRVNDRGPFKNGRIIDLSEKAAETIDAIKDGIASVKLQVIDKR